MATANTPPLTPTLGLRIYGIITLAYWAFTLTDGAIHMLVVLHFHNLGFSPLAIAFLFLFYEIFGIITNGVLTRSVRDTSRPSSSKSCSMT